MANQEGMSKGGQRALIGAGVAAAAGTAAFLLVKRTGSAGAPVEEISDAPDHVWRRGTSRYDQNLVGNTVLVGRSPDELYREWRGFTKFPRFLGNGARGLTLRAGGPLAGRTLSRVAGLHEIPELHGERRADRDLG